MHVIVSTRALRAALKRIFIRRTMDSHVQIEAGSGSLTLSTQSDPSVWIPGNCLKLHATVTITDTLTIEEEGKGFVEYRLLTGSINAGIFDGEQALCLHQEGQLVTVSGTTGLPHRSSLPWREDYAFSRDDNRTVGDSYSQREHCLCTCQSCGLQHHRAETRSYLVAQTATQRILIDQPTLSRLFRCVEWAAPEEHVRTPSIRLALTNDVLSCAATDGRSLALCRHTVAGAGNWEYDLLVPPWQLKRILQLVPKEADLSLTPCRLLCSGRAFSRGVF